MQKRANGPKGNVAVGDGQRCDAVVDGHRSRHIGVNLHVRFVVIRLGKDKGEVNNVGQRQTEQHAANQRKDADEAPHGVIFVMPANAKHGVVVGHVLPPI